MVTLRRILILIAVIACVVRVVQCYNDPTTITANTSSLVEDDVTLPKFEGFLFSFGDAAYYYWKLHISENGDAFYMQTGGTGNTCARFALSAEEISSLLSFLRKGDVVYLADQYDTGASDTDWMHLSLKCNGELKRVSSNTGGPMAIRRVLEYLEANVFATHRAELQSATPIGHDEALRLDLLSFD